MTTACIKCGHLLPDLTSIYGLAMHEAHDTNCHPSPKDEPMDTSHPHDIKSLDEIAPDDVGRHIPLSDDEYELLKDKTPEERGAWLTGWIKRNAEAAAGKAARAAVQRNLGLDLGGNPRRRKL